MTHLKILFVRFSNRIREYEVTKFRGAVIASLENKDVLFHNHQGEGFRYAYPLIQYKRINGQAAILCIGDGADAIKNFLQSEKITLCIGQREEELEVELLQESFVPIQFSENPHEYQIQRWLPFNAENYATFLRADGLAEQVSMLERILTGNILSALKGLGIRAEQQIKCSVKALTKPQIVQYKQTKLMSIDAIFRSNLVLPDFIGLGKHVSVGFGTVRQQY